MASYRYRRSRAYDGTSPPASYLSNEELAQTWFTLSKYPAAALVALAAQVGVPISGVPARSSDLLAQTLAQAAARNLQVRQAIYDWLVHLEGEDEDEDEDQD